MHWQLNQGDRIRYRAIGAEHSREGIVRKPMHVLSAAMEAVPVYVVEPDDGAPIILGDGEILERLTQRGAE
jgi:hypothetical protein